MSGTRAATRSNLLRLTRRRELVGQGVELLERKRAAIVGELFRRARPAVDARRGVDECARAAYRALLDALAVHGRDELIALGWPLREPEVDVAALELWGIPMATIHEHARLERAVGARGLAPGTIADAVPLAARGFERLFDLLLDAAAEEAAMRRLANALSRTTRQVNVLEQRVMVALKSDLDRIRFALAEREREEGVRLRRVRGRRRPCS